MKDVDKIKGSNCSQFTNASHLSFHQRNLERLKMIAFPEKVHITAELGEYETCVAAEQDRTREATGTGLTQEMREADEDREEPIDYVLKTIATAKKSPVAAVKAAGIALEPVANVYGDLLKVKDDEQSSLIVSFLNDLKKTENAAHVTALHLDEVLTIIEESNERFIALKNERLDERIANKKESSRVLRANTDAVYTRITELIYASELLTDDADTLTLIKNIIKELNGVIDEFNASMNRSKGQKKDSETPEEPVAE